MRKPSGAMILTFPLSPRLGHDSLDAAIVIYVAVRVDHRMGEQWGPRPLVPESGTSIPPELVFRPAIMHEINHEPIVVATVEVHRIEIFRRRRGS